MSMKPLLSAALLSACFTTFIAAPAIAADQSADQWTRGEVRKVDLAAGNITIKHEYIAIIDMPPMTMSFAADKSLLDKAKVGDAIRFVVDVKNGKMLVTKLEALPPGK